MAGKTHPHHQGAGMAYFEKDHWEKKMSDVKVSDVRYSSEMGNPEDLTNSVNKLTNYVKSHKAQH
jgi:hypothetical protein